MSRYLIALLLPLFCFAAPQAPPPQAPEPVRFSSRASLVTVPVLVTRSGHPVTGLTRGDFVLTQDGQPQAIAQFEEITTVPPTLPAKRAASGLEPSEFSNIAPAAPTRLTIIALDMAATTFFKQQKAREGVIKYLQANVTAREPIALVAVTRRGIRVIHDFSTDPAILVAALANKTNTPAPAVVPDPSGSGPDLDLADFLMINDSNPNPDAGRFGDMFAQMRYDEIAFSSMDGIVALARAYADIPARKSLLWISAIAPFAPLESNGALKMASEHALMELRNANMAIYPIDASGLSTLFRRAPTPQQGVLMSGHLRGAYSDNGRNAASDASIANRTAQLERVDRMLPVDDMRWIADATGGRAMVNTNDSKGAITRAMDDSAHYYQLSYYLPRDAKPGWHKIKVKVLQSGVQFRTRSGVLVDPPGQTFAPGDDVIQALGSPLDLTGVPLVVRWTGQAGNAREKKHASFELSIPARGLEVDDRDGNRLSFILTVMLRSPQTKNTTRFETTIERRLPPEKLQQFAKEGFQFESAISLPPGRYWVKFLVHDNLSARVGTVTAPLTVE